MPRYQYAGAPTSPPVPTIAVVGGNLTSSKAGTYYFWLQTQNRAGFSLVSVSGSATVAANQAIQLTIPASALPNPSGGVDIQSYQILCATTNDPFNGVIVASKPGYETDGITDIAPPFTITLTEDEHLNLSSLSVATSGSLPTGSDRINGMRRSISDLGGTIYEWSDQDTAWNVAVPQSPTSYVTDLQNSRGANQSLGSLTDLTELIFPEYSLSGDSEPVKYWLVNNESAAIPQGKRIAIAITADIEGIDTDLSNNSGVVGGLNFTFRGYVNTTTGVLDTTSDGGVGTMDGVDESIGYTGDSDTTLVLQKDLPVGSAYVLEASANLDVANLNGLIPDGAVLKFTPSFFEEAATINSAALITGSTILGEYDRRRLVPTLGLNAIALNGTGLLKIPTSQGYSFQDVGLQTVTGLDADTDNQLIAINISGQCIKVSTVPSFAAQRAIIGTADGQGKATAWSSPVTLSSSLTLDVEVTYPTQVRLDYDDAIAGSAGGSFNATFIRIYVRPVGGGNATYWERNITPNVASETFSVGSNAGTDAGSAEPPARPSDRFGLYEPADDSFSNTTAAGSSVFASGDHEVAIAFRFENTITSIDHRVSSGNISELSGTLGDVLSLLSYLRAPVDTVWDLRSISFASRTGNQEVFVEQESNPYRWKPAETSTEDADLIFSISTGSTPTSGQIRLNNSTPASATEAYISETDANSTNISAPLNGVENGVLLRIQSVATETTFLEFAVTGVTDNGSDRSATVTYSSGSGTLTNEEPVVVSWGTQYIRPFDVDFPSAGRWSKDDSDQILALNSGPTAANGEVGDLAIIQNDALISYGDVLKKTSSTTWTTLFNTLPYTSTTAEFNQPAVDSNVTVSVRNSRLFAVGSNVFIEVGGNYEVISKPSVTQLELKNLGTDQVNAAESTAISAGSRVYQSGAQGDSGISAIAITTTDFNQPGEGATRTVNVEDSRGLFVGQRIGTSAQSGNTYEVAAIINGTSIDLRNLAGLGNAAALTIIPSGTKLAPVGQDGTDAIAATTADFTQPAENLTVSATVDKTTGFVAGQDIASSTSTYEIVSIDSTTTLTIRNLTGQGNLAAGQTVSSGTKLVPSGRKPNLIVGAVTTNTLAPGTSATFEIADSNSTPGETTLDVTIGIPAGQTGPSGTVTNTSGVELTEIITPSAPSAGVQKFYAKSNGLHTLDSGGNEVRIASPKIATDTHTTASIENEAVEDFTFTGIGHSGILRTLTLNRAAWIVLYVDAASRSADASRLSSNAADPGSADNPANGSGVIAEVFLSSPGTQLISDRGGRWYFNNDTPLADAIYGAVMNKSGATNTVQIDVEAIAY